MALQKTWQKKVDGFDSELVATNAYCRVAAIQGSKSSLTVDVWVYDISKKNVLDRRVYTFEPSVEKSSLNFIAQAYEHLKLLPDFSNAVDV
jgi:hypothetical protein